MLSAMAACWSASVRRDHICTKESPPASFDFVAYGGVLGDSAFAACGNSADYSAVRSCAIVRGRQASVRRANRWITSTRLCLYLSYSSFAPRDNGLAAVAASYGIENQIDGEIKHVCISSRSCC